MSLKTIKTKIVSIKKTAKVTRAMEAVSAVKMRKAQQRAFSGRGYARAAVRVLTQVAGDMHSSKHPLTQRGGDGKKIGVLIITSDKGLAGALNSAVLKQVTRLIAREDVLGSKVVAFCIGRRGYEYAIRRGFDVRYSDVNVSDDVSTEQFASLTEQAIALFTQKQVREFFVVYTNFKSTFEQEALVRSLLPLSEVTLNEFVAGILPDKGKFAAKQEKETHVGADGHAHANKAVASYKIEPDRESVLAELIPQLFKITLYYALSESKASEHSARMVAMKAATDNAKSLAADLTLQFNRERQASITAEVSEITSGIEAMAV